MDQSELVKAGHIIVRGLDAAGVPPAAAVWVHEIEPDAWKLWIVPRKRFKGEREFYAKVVDVVRKDRNQLGEIDAGDTSMVVASHPAIQGLKRYMKISGLGSTHFSANMFDGFYIPEGIILRMDL